MKWTIERVNAVGFSVIVLLTVIIGLIAWQNAQDLASTSAWVNHTRQVIHVIDATLLEIVTAEGAEHSYIISGDRVELEPYAGSEPRANHGLEQLRSLTEDNPHQQEQLVTLQRLVTAHYEFLDQVITTRQEQGFASAQTLLQSQSVDAHIISQIRTLFDAMIAEEERLLVFRTAAAQSNTREAFITFIGLLVLMTAVLAASSYLVTRYIAAHRRAEAQLEAERNVLRTLIDALPDYVFVKDMAGRFIVSNQAHAQAAQLANPDHLVGKTAQEIFPGELAAQFEADDQLILQSGEALISQERETINAAGNRIWVATTKVPLRDNDHHIIGLVGISRDISQRKAAEEALRRNEALYRTFARNFPNGAIVLFDHEHRYVLVDGLGLKDLGLTKAEMEGKTPREVLPHDIAASGGPYMNAALAGEFAHREVAFRDQIVSIHYVPVRNEDGRIQYGMAMLQIITERIKAEEAHKESEERYRALFNEIADAIIIYDINANILDVNQTACERLGYRRDEFLQMKKTAIDTPDYAATFSERLERLLRAGKLLDVSGVHVSRDGREIPVYVNSQAIAYKGQIAVLAVARDVTTIKRAEQQALELEVERTRVKIITEFVRDISHDFRTPLTVIGTSAYLLSRSTDMERSEGYLNSINLQLRQVTHKIERLLQMVRLDTEQDFAARRVEVGSFLEQIRRQFLADAQKKGVDLSIEQPGSPAYFRADEEQLTQAIGEIIENAIAFTPSGGRVTLLVEPQENAIVIVVQDTGEGISETDLPHIFKRLYRADAARSTERGASGLGLAIVQKIVELHQGSILAESALGKGSTFRVKLPTAI